MNSGDRELLELAAKAYGIELDWFRGGPEQVLTKWDGMPESTKPWNPLTDDGDALRLAVKLGMLIDDIERGYMAGHIVATAGPSMAAYEPRNPDPYAATRRAIVRAAAEIGKAMP